MKIDETGKCLNNILQFGPKCSVTPMLRGRHSQELMHLNWAGRKKTQHMQVMAELPIKLNLELK